MFYITQKLWDYIKSNKLQTRTENGQPENAGKFIVADAKLLTIFKNTNTTSKTGKVTDLRNLKEGETILKYGHDIGKVVKSIKKGEHVHVHNVKTKKW